ncbi:septal ring lytic transglycosylase RlpA family protein [Variovorax sp. LARHSF232]
MTERAARTPAAGYALALIVLLLAGCASGPRGGRDGGPAQAPSDLGQLQDAQPRVETIRSSGGTAKPYTVLGRSYMPITDDRPFRESGLASWYGTKFHAQSTASGEPYDMYAMTAAHKTLPLPSYVRVRNPANGREAIVRVNDRGPFHEDRVIDLSYAAAYKLDLLRGVAPVEIERITNEEIRAGNWQRDGGAAIVVAANGPADVPVPSAMVVPVVATARAEPSALAALPPLDVANDAPGAGFWVQLGAFSQPGGASSLREQAARDLPVLATQLKVFSERGLYRVQAGPFTSREAAQGTADQLRASLQLSPLVLERR